MDLSLQYFWGQMTGNPLLFIAVALTLGVILVNGWTDAPNAIATGRRKTKPIAENAAPIRIAVSTRSEKISFARLLSPSPSVRATSALPPVPNIKPTVDRIISSGKIRFTAAKGVLPAKLDTKNPSTTP